MLAKLEDSCWNAILRMLARIDEPFYSPLNAFVGWCNRIRQPERVVRCGNLNPDKIFYVIRDVPNTAGLAGWHDRVLGYALRARRKGWIPVVQASAPMQPDDGDWYAFFTGPSSYSISEVLQSQNVVFATCQPMIYKRYNKRNIARRHEISRLVGLSEEASRHVFGQIDAIMGDMSRPRVGIRFRGTDYRSYGNYCPVGHAKVMAYDKFCDVIVSDFEKWNISLNEGDSMFVMTEEQEALDAIVRRFPRAHYVRKERYADFHSGRYLVESRLPSMSPKQNNLDYLLEIYAMSRCDYLIGGYNGGVVMALNLNGNCYKGVHIINTGVN